MTVRNAVNLPCIAQSDLELLPRSKKRRWTTVSIWNDDELLCSLGMTSKYHDTPKWRWAIADQSKMMEYYCDYV